MVESIERLLNSGGPMSRTRTERLQATLLGVKGGVHCPRFRAVGIDFGGGADPLTVVFRLLDEAGFASPEALRAVFAMPTQTMACRATDQPAPVRLGTCARLELLEQALLLGLCTPYLYDPSRPVLWTRASLTRKLELFDMGGFYAN